MRRKVSSPERLSGAPLSESPDDLEVGETADDDREEELSGEEEDTVDSPPGSRPGLVTIRPVRLCRTLQQFRTVG